MKIGERVQIKAERFGRYLALSMVSVDKRILDLSDRGRGQPMTQWPVPPPPDFAVTSRDGRRQAPWA